MSKKCDHIVKHCMPLSLNMLLFCQASLMYVFIVLINWNATLAMYKCYLHPNDHFPVNPNLESPWNDPLLVTDWPITAQQQVSLCCNPCYMPNISNQTSSIHTFIGVMEENNNFSPVDLYIVYGQFMAEVIWLHCPALSISFLNIFCHNFSLVGRFWVFLVLVS